MLEELKDNPQTFNINSGTAILSAHNLINERNRGQSNLPIPNMIIEDRRINTNTLIHELQIKKIIKVIYH